MQGNPKTLKTLYGLTGKREHSEWEAKWLPGYRGSKPVQIGNKASDQLQLDTFGEVMDALYRARRMGLYPLEDRSGRALELPLLEHLEKTVDRAGLRFVGVSLGTAAVHAVEGDGMGGVRSRHSHGGEIWNQGPG